MKLLITGVSGQLGHEVSSELEKRNYKCFTDRFDITDRRKALEAVNSFRPDAIIHCAAWTNVDDAEEQPEKCRAVNVTGTRNVAEAAKSVNAKLIYISTDYVFDGSGTEPWNEDDTPHPLSVYGQSKLDGEKAVQELVDRHFIVRTAWLYGRGKNFVKTMLRLGQERESVRVVDDQIGTPTYTADLARLLVDMAESNLYGTYHAVNSGGYISWYDFTKEIFAQAGINCRVAPVSSEEYCAKAVRPKNSRLNTEKLREAGFSPLPDWSEALKSYLTGKNS